MQCIHKKSKFSLVFFFIIFNTNNTLKQSTNKRNSTLIQKVTELANENKNFFNLLTPKL